MSKIEWQPPETAPVNTPVLCWIDGFLMVPNVLTLDETGEWRESAVDGRALRYPQNVRAWMHLPEPPQFIDRATQAPTPEGGR